MLSLASPWCRRAPIRAPRPRARRRRGRAPRASPTSGRRRCRGVVGDLVREIDDLRLEHGLHAGRELLHQRPIVLGRVLDDALAHLPGEVQAGEVRDSAPRARRRCAGSARCARSRRTAPSARSSTRSPAWPNGVWPRSCASATASAEVLVEAERRGERARDLRRLDRVRQPRPVVVALVVDEDLRLVLEAAERRAVDDAVAVALERQPERMLGLGVDAPAASRCCASRRWRASPPPGAAAHRGETEEAYGGRAKQHPTPGSLPAAMKMAARYGGRGPYGAIRKLVVGTRTVFWKIKVLTFASTVPSASASVLHGWGWSLLMAVV